MKKEAKRNLATSPVLPNSSPLVSVFFTTSADVAEGTGRPSFIIAMSRTGEVLGDLPAKPSHLLRIETLRRLSTSGRILRQTREQIAETQETILRSTVILMR